jgi:hypothetical protein
MEVCLSDKCFDRRTIRDALNSYAVPRDTLDNVPSATDECGTEISAEELSLPDYVPLLPLSSTTSPTVPKSVEHCFSCSPERLFGRSSGLFYDYPIQTSDADDYSFLCRNGGDVPSTILSNAEDVGQAPSRDAENSTSCEILPSDPPHSIENLGLDSVGQAPPIADKSLHQVPNVSSTYPSPAAGSPPERDAKKATSVAVDSRRPASRIDKETAARMTEQEFEMLAASIIMREQREKRARKRKAPAVNEARCKFDSSSVVPKAEMRGVSDTLETLEAGMRRVVLE